MSKDARGNLKIEVIGYRNLANVCLSFVSIKLRRYFILCHFGFRHLPWRYLS